VIQRGEEFETLEKGEASAEMKNLRVDLATMMSRIEVRVKSDILFPFEP
jgi:abortive infection bacteriophage resistance protein